MTLLEKVTELIAGQINLDKDSREALLYGLQVFCYSAAGFLAVLAVGWALNCLPETVTVTITVALLRSLAGGAHCTTPLRCTVVTALVFPLLGRTASLLETIEPLHPAPFILLISLLALTIILWRAPVDSPAKPITTKEHRRRLRTLSVSVVIILAAVQFILLQHQSGAAHKVIISAGLGMLWETFMLTKTGHKFMALLDSLLRNPFAKEVNRNA